MNQSRAVVIREPGGVEVLDIVERSCRAPGGGEVLIRVAAAGLNRADVLQRRGFYPAPKGAPADVPGLEFAGTVEEVGPGVVHAKVGDRVMGIAAGGGMAERLLAHESELVPVPTALSLEQAAAVPEVFFTAYDALFLQAGLTLGDTALLHAVGSGIGTAAVQLCRASQVTAIGTARTQEKLERAGELGLEHGILAEDGAFAAKVAELTGKRGADVILDVVGAAYLGENVKSLAPLGRLVVIGLLGGVKGELPLGLLLARRARVIGTVLRSRTLAEKATLARQFAEHVVPLFERGLLQPVVDEVMPMTEVRAAHTRMESNQTFGKLVLSWEAGE